MQGVPEGIDFDEVYNLIKKIKGVKSIHSLHIWSVNSKEAFLSCHVCVNRVDYKGKDKLIKQINEMLDSKFEIEHTTIQLEDEACSNNELCGK